MAVPLWDAWAACSRGRVGGSLSFPRSEVQPSSHKPCRTRWARCPRSTPQGWALPQPCHCHSLAGSYQELPAACEPVGPALYFPCKLEINHSRKFPCWEALAVFYSTRRCSRKEGRALAGRYVAGELQGCWPWGVQLGRAVTLLDPRMQRTALLCREGTGVSGANTSSLTLALLITSN